MVIIFHFKTSNDDTIYQLNYLKLITAIITNSDTEFSNFYKYQPHFKTIFLCSTVDIIQGSDCSSFLYSFNFLKLFFNYFFIYFYPDSVFFIFQHPIILYSLLFGLFSLYLIYFCLVFCTFYTLFLFSNTSKPTYT